jgi:hypothetical protein
VTGFWAPIAACSGITRRLPRRMSLQLLISWALEREFRLWDTDPRGFGLLITDDQPRVTTARLRANNNVLRPEGLDLRSALRFERVVRCIVPCRPTSYQARCSTDGGSTINHCCKAQR